ncbi:hypothetical protein AgCh_039444 [Apium graveolens]
MRGVVGAVKPGGSNPSGNARPKEEVLKKKGQDWKEVDEAAGLNDGPSFGKRSFDGYEDIAHEAETGKIYRADYFDKHGRYVVVMRPGYENSMSNEGKIKYLVYCIEKPITSMEPVLILKSELKISELKLSELKISEDIHQEIISGLKKTF